MAGPRIKAAVINPETFLQAFIINLRNVYSPTPTLRKVVKAPDGYDCGARLFGLEKSGYLEKKSNGGSNLYRATSKGKQRLLQFGDLVQQFGIYDIVTVNDPDQPQAILGSAYSAVADQAMSELAGIIEKNSRLKNTLAGLIQQIDLAIGDI
jgi:hypothetical protein